MEHNFEKEKRIKLHELAFFYDSQEAIDQQINTFFIRRDYNPKCHSASPLIDSAWLQTNWQAENKEINE